MIEKVGHVSNKSLKKHTGKNWDDWIQILKDQGAQNWSHQEIVAFLKKKHKVTIWWQQIVTTGFEVTTGKRVQGQNLKGLYSTVATRTFPITNKEAWKLICSEKGLMIWLQIRYAFQIKKGANYENSSGVFGEIRTFKAGQRIRMTWQEVEWDKPTVVQVLIMPRPKKKCMVVFQHEGLTSLKMKNEMKDHWKKALAELASTL